MRGIVEAGVDGEAERVTGLRSIGLESSSVELQVRPQFALDAPQVFQQFGNRVLTHDQGFLRAVLNNGQERGDENPEMDVSRHGLRCHLRRRGRLDVFHRESRE